MSVENRIFEYKTYGRIFVSDESRITEVNKILFDLSPYEWLNYRVDEMVSSLKEYPKLVYTGIYSPHISAQFKLECAKRGIAILIITGIHDEYSNSPVVKHKIEDYTISQTNRQLKRRLHKIVCGEVLAENKFIKKAGEEFFELTEVSRIELLKKNSDNEIYKLVNEAMDMLTRWLVQDPLKIEEYIADEIELDFSDCLEFLKLKRY